MSRPKGSKNKPKKPPLFKNAGICGLCNEAVTSTHRHDFCQCSCGNLFVDGGNDYQRYGWDSERENGKSVLWNNFTRTWQTLANLGKEPEEKEVKKKVKKEVGHSSIGKKGVIMAKLIKKEEKKKVEKEEKKEEKTPRRKLLIY